MYIYIHTYTHTNVHTHTKSQIDIACFIYIYKNFTLYIQQNTIFLRPVIKGTKNLEKYFFFGKKKDDKINIMHTKRWLQYYKETV